MKIAIISCSKKKLTGTYPAYKLYSASDYFNKSFKYANKISNRVLILSSKYGCLNPKDIISTYEETLNKKPTLEKKIWAKKVYDKLKSIIKNNDEIIWLCGENYRKYLISMFNNKQTIPIKGLVIGKQLKFYKERL